nr:MULTISPECIES: LamG domain-containing protein [unclassified Streptomyces]
MDDSPGSSTFTGTGGAFTVAPASGATAGAAGHNGNALALDGTTNGYAATQASVVDTTRSFTVAAWVNPTAVTGSHMVVSQDGYPYTGGFGLGLDNGKWAFMTTAVANGPGLRWQVAFSDAPVTAGTWTHLLGEYNAAAKTVSVYVDGSAPASAPAPLAEEARGPLEFGRFQLVGAYTFPWQGAVDDVHIWDRALPAADAVQAAAGTGPTAGTAAKVIWPFDEPTGAAALTGKAESSDAAVFGNPQNGITGVTGKAVHFDGVDDYAVTARPQVDGAASFSVSAWVRLPAIAAGDTRTRTVLTQAGLHNSEFAMYYAPDVKKWVFGRYRDDISADTLVRASQPACAGPIGTTPCFGAAANEWTHLLGVSDATAGRIRLYINGYLVGENTYVQTKPWTAPGGMQIGAASREGKAGEWFGGDVDDVRVFDRVLTDPEAHEMVQQRPQLAGHWKFDTASGTPLAAPDEAGPAHNAVLYNQAYIDGAGGVTGTGGLSTNGTTDYAATVAPPLHTGQSFTLAGWAQTAGSPDRDMTVLSLGGGTNSSVTIRWDFLKTVSVPGSQEVENLGQWQVEVTDKDASGATRTGAVHTFDPAMRMGYWNHLAVVYDSFTDQLTLYVNGQPENQLCPDGDTSGTCTDHVSWTTASQPFESTGGLQFGRNRSGAAWTEYFSGELNDVWAYQGVLSAAQITTLADPTAGLDVTTAP